MNIHEYQAKAILKKFGIKVLNGVPVFNLNEIEKKFKILKTSKIAVKAQIHAGGRGKAGGIKIVKNIEELKTQAKNLSFKLVPYFFIAVTILTTFGSNSGTWA